jgi:hypothetical protein
MGVTWYDSEPDKWLGYQRHRDEFLPADDRFMWTIDTFLDERSGYFFEMNPSGLMACTCAEWPLRDRRVLLRHRDQTIFGLTVRARPGYIISLNGEWNQIDLAEGSFASNVFRGVADTQFSPFMALVNIIQYDTMSRVLGWQITLSMDFEARKRPLCRVHPQLGGEPCARPFRHSGQTSRL